MASSGILDEILRSLGLLFMTVVIGFFVIWLILRLWKSKDDRVHVHKATEQNIKNGTPTLGQADGRKPVEPDMPWCSTETPDDRANGSGNGTTDTDGDMQRAWIPPDAVWPWKTHKILYVEFRHVDLLADWTINNGQPMNTDSILRYANTWSDIGGGKIPRFVEATHGKQAQIRVSFNNDQIRNSHLGKRAQQVPAKDPTMNLDLKNGCPDDQYKKHVIIHEFGHALGLGHEHQRSDFWKCIKPFTNIEKMRKELGVTKKQFDAQWKEIGQTEAGHHTEYDPDSIMHYWCKSSWLKNGYSDKKKVEEDRDSGHLSKKVAKALLGVHQRHEILANEPSKLDIQLLKKVYGDGEGTQTGTGGAIEQDYDDPVAVGGPNPRTGVQGEKKRVAADSGNSHDTITEKPRVDVPVKGQKVVKVADEESELMTEQEYDFDVTSDYLSRMEYTENGEKKDVSIYEESKNMWRVIGERLGLADCVLDGFVDDCRNVRARVISVLKKWQENARGLPHKDQYPKTWRGLMRLLENSGLAELAKKVEKALPHQKPQSTEMASAASVPPAQAQAISGQNEEQGRLRIGDLNTVKNELWSVRAYWKNIGGALKIERGTIDCIARKNMEDSDHCLGDMIATWLRGSSTPEKPITWAGLVTALKQQTLQETCGDIAEEIRKKYNVQ